MTQEVIFEAKQADLIAQDILARPRFISMPTGREYPIDDRLYTRLVREHKDLPEEIIGRLAGDAGRNDYIVNEYVRHPEYGKTIIFADRWFQCVYLKGKLRDKGIKAGAVYSHIDADPGSAEARNKQTSDDNKRILEKFKNGQGDDALDVLINVRMLTEGTDVPSIKTAFITRQTTSPTLMTQMIGRALRGKKAGGGDNKDEANIVFFVDEWKQLINWATPSLEGGVDDSKRVRGYYPLEYISIRLVEELTKQINSGIIFQVEPFSHILPVGWYQTEIVVNTSEENNDEMQSFAEFVMVYEHTKPKFEKFMSAIAGRLPDDWAKEYLSDEWMRPWVTEWIGAYFAKENDNIGNTLAFDLIRIARHIAQKQTSPVYYPFEERNEYDLDKLAAEVLQKRYNDFEQEELLGACFSKPGSLWKTFYRSLDRFKTAFYGAKQRQLHIMIYGNAPIHPSLPPGIPPRVRELTEGEKEQIKKHDGNTCQACDAHGRGIKLEIDHIIPVQWGGKTTVDNSQTLCSVCNKEKGINEINFRNHVTLLGSPKELVLLPRHGTEDVKQSITRLVNFFYHCKAVCQVRLHQRRSGSHYSTWEIELYPGNNPEWLLQHKQALITHIQNKFRCAHVKNIRIISAA